MTLQEGECHRSDRSEQPFRDRPSTPAGYEDYSTVAVDIDKKDEAYSPKTYESLRGIRMPDSIALYSVGGTDYVVTANEGDSREWGDYLNEVERNFKDDETSPTGKITADNSGLTGKVVFFDSSDYDGLDTNLDYLFGGRSFTVYKADGNGLTEVFDSGSDFEAKTAVYVPENFNCSNDDKTIRRPFRKEGTRVRERDHRNCRRENLRVRGTREGSAA